jgi:hypothetical protein
VVKIDGYQAGFGDYLMRWFFRIIDFSSFYGLVGLIAVVSSKKAAFRRYGCRNSSNYTKKQNQYSHTILEVTYVPSLSFSY